MQFSSSRYAFSMLDLLDHNDSVIKAGTSLLFLVNEVDVAL